MDDHISQGPNVEVETKVDIEVEDTQLSEQQSQPFLWDLSTFHYAIKKDMLIVPNFLGNLVEDVSVDKSEDLNKDRVD